LTEVFKELKTQISIAAIELGQSLAPMVRKITNNVKDMVKAWRGTSSEFKSAVGWIGGITASLGPLAFAIAAVSFTVGNLAKAFVGLKIAGAFLLANPYVLLFTAIALAIGGIVVAANEAGKAIRDLAKGEARSKRSESIWRDELGSDWKGSIKRAKAARSQEKYRSMADRAERAAMEKYAIDQTSDSAVKPYVQTEEDIKAQKSYMDLRKKAIYDQLTTEQKITQTIREQSILRDQIKKSQAESVEYYKLMSQASELETEMAGLAETRKGEIKSEAEKKRQTTPTYAAAAEMGSVEAYRQRLAASRKDDVGKNTKDTVTKLDELKRTLKENTTDLLDGIKSLGFEQTEVVSI